MSDDIGKVIVYVRADYLTEMFTAGSVLRDVFVLTGLPPGARLVRLQMDMLLDRVAMIFEHESFEAVGDGQQIPERKVWYTTRRRR